jgi:hypothetical protein
LNKLSIDIYNILKTELSAVTSKMILEEKCRKIGRDSDTVNQEDLNDLFPLILGPVILFGGEKKAQLVKDKLNELKEGSSE